MCLIQFTINISIFEILQLQIQSSDNWIYSSVHLTFTSNDMYGVDVWHVRVDIIQHYILHLLTRMSSISTAAIRQTFAKNNIKLMQIYIWNFCFIREFILLKYLIKSKIESEYNTSFHYTIVMTIASSDLRIITILLSVAYHW